MTLDTITREEFDRRLDAANARLRQEVADAEKRVQQLETLIQRKEAFLQKLDRVLDDTGRENAKASPPEEAPLVI